MAYDPDNVFARILRNEIPAHKVYEDALTLAFMDVMPQSPGHTLVIPKSAAENLYELPPNRWPRPSSRRSVSPVRSGRHSTRRAS